MGSRKLWIWSTLPKNLEENPDKSWLNQGDAVENVQRLSMGGHGNATFDSIISGSRFPQTVQHDVELLGEFSRLTKPGGSIKIVQVVGNDIPKLMSANKLVSTIKLAGLVNVQSPKITDFANANEEKEIRETLNIPVGSQCQIAEIDCSVPNFQAGSSKPLSFAQKIKKPVAEKKVWSLKDMDDDDVDLIDEDDLLEEEDKVKPDQASLRVCGTTGKRKACKDCSCGLAEELDSGKEPTKKSVTSSCGSCYLGDAFRCASCPYLGMPAFKPGEKIQLSERQLKADQ